MISKFRGTLLLLFWAGVSFAQTGDTASTSATSASTSNTPTETKKPNEFVFKPTIGLGTGMFSFYGDTYNKHFQSPSLSRIGYDLTVSQRMTDYLLMNFYVLFGQLGANEHYA